MNEKELRDLINGVFSGKYTLENLPFNPFRYTAEQLLEAFESGWRTRQLTDPDIESPDAALFNSFRDNLWYFSANKTATQVQELQDLLHDAEGNRRSLYDFTKDALKLDGRYNSQYLAVEYDLTFKLANSGREWREIEDTANIFPFLEWVTVMDENTRHGHLNGIVRRVDDEFWNTHPIPLEYGCRCRKRQLRQAEETDLAKLELVDPPKRPWHANIVRNREVWKNREHPYFAAAVTSGIVAEELLISLKEQFPNYTTKKLKNGATVNTSAYHFPHEVAENRRLAEIIANNHGRSINLPPHHDSKYVIGYKNTDYQDAVTLEFGDLKQPKGLNGIKGLADKSVSRLLDARRNPSFLVFELDFEFQTMDLARVIRGTFNEGRNTRIKEIFLVHDGRSSYLSRNEIETSFQKVYEAALKIKSGA